METDRLIRLMPPEIQDKSWRTWLKQSSKSESSVVGKKINEALPIAVEMGVLGRICTFSFRDIEACICDHSVYCYVKKPRELGESIEPVMHSLVLPAKNAKAVDLAVTGSPAARHFGYHVAALAKRGAPQLGVGSPPLLFFFCAGYLPRSWAGPAGSCHPCFCAAVYTPKKWNLARHKCRWNSSSSSATNVSGLKTKM